MTCNKVNKIKAPCQINKKIYFCTLKLKKAINYGQKAG